MKKLFFIILIASTFLTACASQDDKIVDTLSSATESNEKTDTETEPSTSEIYTNTEPITEPYTDPPTQPPTMNPLIIKKGDKGDDVKDLQVKLRDAGFYTGDIDGSFGPMTETSVKKLQESYNLAADGVVQGETWIALDDVPKSANTLAAVPATVAPATIAPATQPPTEKLTEPPPTTQNPTEPPTQPPTQAVIEPQTQPTTERPTQPPTTEIPTNKPTESINTKSNENYFNLYDIPEQQNTTLYVLNTSTKKIHLSTCAEVKKIKPENYSTIESRESAIKQGYEPCKKCNP
jgi:peptidoglycan hydrolase-like protein with peptidoglycan-binding domain